MIQRLIVVVLLIFIFFRLGSIIYSKRAIYFVPNYDKKYENFKTLYYSSQYVKKNNPSIISDNTLESFAGGAFLKGLNPILIVHDQPPLGRYIVSLSILLFNNAATTTLLLLIISVVGIFLIAKSMMKDTILSLLALAIFFNEPLFLSKLTFIPLLEPIQFPFIIFTLYFFIKGNLEKKYLRWFIFSSAMLGFVISIRFFSLGAVLFGSMALYFLLQKRFDKKFLFFLLTTPLSIVVLLSSYARTILDGYTIREIFGIQKYILVYHKSMLVLPFTVFDLLLFNRWHTWWGDRSISSDSEWLITWPIITILSLISIAFSLGKKINLNEAEKVIGLWVVCYLMFLSLGYSSVRYFLPLIPFLYLLAFSFIIKIIRMKFPKIKSLL